MGLKVLGKGANGTVYDLGFGYVMKVTGDRSEAIASKRIARENIPGVWKVCCVFGAGKKWIIIGQKLRPNPSKAEAIFEYLLDAVGSSVVPGTVDPLELRPEMVRRIKDREARNLAIGLIALKKRGIYYFDLNPENIMFDGNNAVIVDLGLADID